MCVCYFLTLCCLTTWCGVTLSLVHQAVELTRYMLLDDFVDMSILDWIQGGTLSCVSEWHCHCLTTTCLLRNPRGPACPRCS